MDKKELKKYIVPIFVVSYGESESDAVHYVEQALDSTGLVFEDGIFSVEILEDEVETFWPTGLE
jgi:hypothetical protein|tara:strand:- start:103 stop:294 length:192 start_codon:yes stop_codon:yes gene_type:complete